MRDFNGIGTKAHSKNCKKLRAVVKRERKESPEDELQKTLTSQEVKITEPREA